MKKLIIFSVVTILLIACDKKEVVKLDFNVEANNTTINVGDTVTFAISGNPDQLTFYSGETGSQFENRERTNADGTPILEFTSFRQYGVQVNTLFLLASTDFTGDYSEAGINNATWTDITDQAIFSTNADNTPSGEIDLSAFKSDKPIYLAFKFVGVGGTTQRTWTIKNLAIKNELDNGLQIPVATIADAGWSILNFNNSTSTRQWTANATQLQFQGGAATIGDNLGWIITKPIFLTKVSPDKGTALKNMSTRMDTFQYVFNNEGEFIVTFVAANENVYGSSADVKEIKIKVNP